MWPNKAYEAICKGSKIVNLSVSLCSNFRVVATAPTGVHSTMGLAIVQSEMVLLSVVRRLNNNINNNSNNQSTGSNSQSDHGGSPSNEWSPDHTASSPNSPQNSSNGHPVLEHTGLSSNGQITPPVTAGTCPSLF